MIYSAKIKSKQRQDKGGDEEGKTSAAVAQAGAADNQRVGGVFRDLCIVEPDDDPLSCLADEEGSTGGGRPKMRFLVAPVNPELAVSQSGRDRVSSIQGCRGCTEVVLRETFDFGQLLVFSCAIYPSKESDLHLCRKEMKAGSAAAVGSASRLTLRVLHRHFLRKG